MRVRFEITGLDICGRIARQAKLLVGALSFRRPRLQDKITPRQALDLFGSFYPESFAGR